VDNFLGSSYSGEAWKIRKQAGGRMSTKVREIAKLPLTPDQQVVAEELRTQFRSALDSDITALAQLLATKTDATFFGATEFQIRDLVLGMGAKALETAVAVKKKRAMPAVRTTAPAAPRQPSSIAGNPNVC
jgi:hypothetical protein